MPRGEDEAGLNSRTPGNSSSSSGALTSTAGAARFAECSDLHLSPNLHAPSLVQQRQALSFGGGLRGDEVGDPAGKAFCLGDGVLEFFLLLWSSLGLGLCDVFAAEKDLLDGLLPFLDDGEFDRLPFLTRECRVDGEPAREAPCLKGHSRPIKHLPRLDHCQQSPLSPFTSFVLSETGYTGCPMVLACSSRT